MSDMKKFKNVAHKNASGMNLRSFVEWVREFRHYLIALLFILVIFVSSKVIVDSSWVPSESMEPTLPTDSVLLGKKKLVAGELKHGQIITFWHIDASMTEPAVYVKRIIGLPGDEIAIRNGKVFRNGIELEEDYLPDGTITHADDIWQTDTMSMVLPEGCLFVLGDNRENSVDCRVFPDHCIRIEDVIGVGALSIKFPDHLGLPTIAFLSPEA